MHKVATFTLLALLAAFGIVFYWGHAYGYENPFNPYSTAIRQLNRAETAQTPDEVAYHMTAAKGQLPENGHVSWWSDDEKGDFGLIQAKLDGIISRTQNISLLEPENELYILEMSNIHLDLKEIQETLTAL